MHPHEICVRREFLDGVDACNLLYMVCACVNVRTVLHYAEHVHMIQLPLYSSLQYASAREPSATFMHRKQAGVRYAGVRVLFPVMTALRVSIEHMLRVCVMVVTKKQQPNLPYGDCALSSVASVGNTPSSRSHNRGVGIVI